MRSGTTHVVSRDASGRGSGAKSDKLFRRTPPVLSAVLLERCDRVDASELLQDPLWDVLPADALVLQFIGAPSDRWLHRLALSTRLPRSEERRVGTGWSCR